MLWYNHSATVMVAEYITHIPYYAGRGVTADTRSIPQALRDGGKTSGGKNYGSCINETTS